MAIIRLVIPGFRIGLSTSHFRCFGGADPFSAGYNFVVSSDYVSYGRKDAGLVSDTMHVVSQFGTSTMPPR